MFLRLTFILALLAASLSVTAAQTDTLLMSIGVSAENSDNIKQTQADKVSENIFHTKFLVDYTKESSVLKTHLNLSGDYQDYQKNTYPDQMVYSSLFGLNATLIKNRLFWDMENTFDRVRSNYNAANVPTNQENTNYFTTGPKYIIFQNDKSTLTTKLKYENFYAETSNDDYSGHIINADYLRNISRTFSIGFDVNYNDRSFADTTANTDYARTDYVVKFNRRTKSAVMSMDVGETVITSNAYETNNQSIFRARYIYKFGSGSEVNASYRREVGDFAGVFTGGTTAGGNLPIVGSSLFLLKEGTFTVTHKFGLSTLSYGYNYFSNEYTDNTLNINTNTTQFTFTRQLSESLTTNITGMYVDSLYPGLDRYDIQRIYNYGLRKTYSNKYDLTFGIYYIDSTSTDSGFIFEERRINLGGNYYFR